MNKLYQGDNLSIMRDMPDASVDLIATDPPFCTQRDWGAFSDKWKDGLDGYLKFMEQRVVEMRRVLKDTGSLYLHCDPTASHYLKVMLDGVFGIKQFRNEIVWTYSTIGSAKKKFLSNHDVILFYAMSNDSVFNIDTVRIPLADSSIKRMKYKPTVNKTLRPTGQWKIHANGKILEDTWKIPVLASTANERLGYPTQKPRKLYERIIKASSNQGDVVLDPFCGSGTTLDAAQSLGRQWIGIDIGDDAIETTEKRLKERHGLLLEYQKM